MTRRHGDVSTPPNVDPARCYPECPTKQCANCARYQIGESPLAEDRPLTVVIDCSVIRRHPTCPMFIQSFNS